MHHIVPPTAVARPDFCGPVIREFFKVDHLCGSVEIVGDGEVGIHQGIHLGISYAIPLLDLAVVFNEIVRPRFQAVIFFYVPFIDPRSDVVNAHILTVDEYNAGTKSLQSHWGIGLGK